MRHPPKVSILMPVYNGGRYFELALQSALAQTYDDIEIVIINDGSTDAGETDAICRRHAGSHPDKVRYLSQANGGVGAALNAGVGAMTGDVFCWLSHDDLFEPHKVRAQVDFFERLGRDDAILISDYRRIDPHGNPIDEIRLDHAAALDSPRLPLFGGWINGCTIFVPAHLLGVDPFDPRYRHVQDYRLWLRLQRDHEIFHQPEMLVRYRIHPGQDSQKPEAVAEGEALWIDIMKAASCAVQTQLSGSRWRFHADAYAYLTAPLHYPAAAAHALEQRDQCLSATLVSVVLTVGDAPSRAAEALLGLLNQTHAALDIVIAAGDMPRSLAEIARADRRVRSVRAGAGGLGDLLLHTRGEYIAFADPGESLGADHIERLVQAMQRAGALLARTGSSTDPAPAASETMIHRLLVAEGFGLGTDVGAFAQAWAEAARRRPVLALDSAEAFERRAPYRPMARAAERLLEGLDQESRLPEGRQIDVTDPRNQYRHAVSIQPGVGDLPFGLGETPWDYVGIVPLDPALVKPGARLRVIIQADETAYALLVDGRFEQRGPRQEITPGPIASMLWFELSATDGPLSFIVQAGERPRGGGARLGGLTIFQTR